MLVVWQVLPTLFDLLRTLWHLWKLSLFNIWVNVDLFVFSSTCVPDQISGLINLSTFLCSLQRVFWILPTCPQVDLCRFAQSGFPQFAWAWRDWEVLQQQSRPQVGGFWKKSVNLFKTVMSQKDGDWQNYVPETLDETNDVPETLDETFNPKQTLVGNTNI